MNLTRTSFAAALAAAALACTGLPERPDGSGGEPLWMGITAPTGVPDAKREADALDAALGQALGRRATSRVFERYEDLVAALGRGEIDLAWMPPLAFVRAEESSSVRPIRKALRQGRASYRAVLFARADRSVASLRDLAGKKVAWVGPTSASGYLFPRALLVGAGLDPEKLFGEQKFLGDHEAVCRAVVDGTADVGATFTDDVDPSPARISACSAILAEDVSRLRVITATEPMPNDLVVARAGLSPEVADAVGAALDSLAARPDAAEVLGKLFNCDGFAKVEAGDYAPVKRALFLLEPPKR